MTRPAVSARATFLGASDNKLVADIFGDDGPPVLLLHGGGQTRHAWRGTAQAIARTGRVAYALDQRGHGDSEWVTDGAYTYSDYAADAKAVATALTQRSSTKPIAIGASLGGIALMLAEGAEEKNSSEKIFSAIVLVDITPRIDAQGVARIHAFMGAHSKEGFASIEDAAQAVAEYLPHRPKPKNYDGLKKNLRMSPDGRWRWHWDPRFIDGVRRDGPQAEEALVSAASRIAIPALLVRGASSELVQEAHAQEFLELVPHAEYVDVSGARHMVAGDRNDQFSQAVLAFLQRLR